MVKAGLEWIQDETQAMQLLPPSCPIASDSTHQLERFINTAVNAQPRYGLNKEVAMDRIEFPVEVPAVYRHQLSRVTLGRS